MPADATPAREEPAGGEKPSPRADLLKKLNPLAHVGPAAAVVGLIASVVGLVFLFKPDLQPKPAPDIGSLKIVDSNVRQPVTFGRYLERVRSAPGTLTEETLRRRGLLVEFDFVAEGFRGKRLPIQWDLVDAKTNDRVSGDGALGITPSTNNDAAKWFVWVPAPAAGRTYYVTVTIYRPLKGEGDVPLADFDTPQFSGSGA
jgi:hypothetical protein